MKNTQQTLTHKSSKYKRFIKSDRLLRNLLASLTILTILVAVFSYKSYKVYAQQSQTAAFEYDGGGQRIAKYDKTTGIDTYYISPDLEVTVKSNTPTGWRKSYYSNNQLTAVRDKSGVDYIHSDQIGSTSLVTNSSGSIVAKERYYPYGTTRATLGTIPTERQFTGQVSDVNTTGLYYYNARYYDPTIGKFTQADNSNDQLNKYAYVGNNPITNTDPTGNMLTAGSGGGGGGVCNTPLCLAKNLNYSNQKYNLDIAPSGVAGIQTLTTWNGSPQDYPFKENQSGNPTDFYNFLATTLVGSAAAPAIAAGGGYAALYEAVDTINCLAVTGGDPMCASGVLPGPNPVTANKVATEVVDSEESLNNFIAKRAQNMNPETDIEMLYNIADIVDYEVPYNDNYMMLPDLMKSWDECGGVCVHRSSFVTGTAQSMGYNARNWAFGFVENGETKYHQVTIVNLKANGLWVVDPELPGYVAPFSTYTSDYNINYRKIIDDAHRLNK